MILEFTISSDWARIVLVRKAVTCSVAAAIEDSGLSHELAMVSAELLENAVKYGVEGKVSFALRVSDGEAVVRVTNAVDRNTGNIQKLRGRLAWISSFPDPADAYALALQQIAESTDVERTSSGLGLIRIVSEAGCRLECDDSTPDHIVMSARRPLSAAPTEALSP